MKSQRSKLLKFWEENKDNAEPFGWLQGRSYSEAFVICVGAGPWKFKRRADVQCAALNQLRKASARLDISDILETINWYPLDWQNKFLSNAVNTLQAFGISFDEYCNNLSKENSLSSMRRLVETTNAKVISLFCRDALQVPSFPIDRHVRRKLKELDLPDNEDAMIKLCADVGIDPRMVAVIMVRTASDMDNPDWSIK